LHGGKSDNLLEELNRKKRVVYCEEIKKPDGIYKRIGYVALFEVENLTVSINPEKTHKTIE
jgi:hypothetical protein